MIKWIRFKKFQVARSIVAYYLSISDHSRQGCCRFEQYRVGGRRTFSVPSQTEEETERHDDDRKE